MSRVVLSLPEVAGAAARLSPRARLPRLARMLARAQVSASPIDGGPAGAFSLLGAVIERGRELPVAAITFAHDGGDPAAAHWLRADPVHLRPDLARLRLFGTDMLDLREEESEVLGSTVAEALAEHGLTLHRPHAHRWYLRVEAGLDLRTTAPAGVAGADIAAAMPSGSDAARWCRLLNEIQMVLHDHPVNRAREQRGQAAVNSVWFWGYGPAPSVPAPQELRVRSADPVLGGLARLAGLEPGPAPREPGELLANLGPGAVLVTLAPDAAAVRDEPQPAERLLEALERDWVPALAQALREGVVAVLEIHPGNGRCYRVTRRDLRRWWRRAAPVQRLLGVAGAPGA